MTVIAHVMRRYQHRGCCEQFAGRVVTVKAPVDENGTYVLAPPFCGLSGCELWLHAIDAIEWEPSSP